jgi:hypothetical protein
LVYTFRNSDGLILRIVSILIRRLPGAVNSFAKPTFKYYFFRLRHQNLATKTGAPLMYCPNLIMIPFPVE